ncbi:MAG: phosphatase PAP2 family protein, partial [Corynebacterium casei]|nr:phosphatase PAP2 family protein [Corynebacterium casei]
VLKYTINRPRPPVQEQLVYTYDPSFPSGHSSAAFAIATAVIVLLATKTWRAKYPWAVAIMVIVGASASAASRIYLGVHWLSDVIAGTGIGIAAALSVWAAGSYVYRRRPRVR